MAEVPEAFSNPCLVLIFYKQGSKEVICKCGQCHINIQGSGESSALPTFDIGSKLAELKQTRKLGTAITMKVSQS